MNIEPDEFGRELEHGNMNKNTHLKRIMMMKEESILSNTLKTNSLSMQKGGKTPPPELAYGRVTILCNDA